MRPGSCIRQDIVHFLEGGVLAGHDPLLYFIGVGACLTGKLMMVIHFL